MLENKKKTNRFLLVALIIIWALVAFKLIRPFFRKQNNVIVAEMLPKKRNLVLSKRDTFELDFPKRDPFLGKRKHAFKNKPVKKEKVVARPTKKIENRTLPWPEIQYLGFVKSKNSSSKLGLIKLNGKLHRVKENHMLDGLRVLKISSDELLILKGKEKKVVSKN